ncbi:MAG: hypothetical protein AAFV80_10260 [Bacteroidota bacterium]
MNWTTCFTVVLALLFFVTSCSDPVYTPRPRGYPRIDFPDRVYEKADPDYCNFNFEIPTYATLVQDTLFFDSAPENPCWFNLELPSLNGAIHCSYTSIPNRAKFDQLVDGTYKLANKHNVRADYISDFLIQKGNGVSGAVLELEGSVASPFQFYLTDSTNHFLRGALYFNSRPAPDSMAPVIEFVKADMMHLINTFAWE